METLILEDRYGYYDYEIWSYSDDDYPSTKYYYYKILDTEINSNHGTDIPVIRESQEYFESVAEAKFAAIGHISLLENGEI